MDFQFLVKFGIFVYLLRFSNVETTNFYIPGVDPKPPKLNGAAAAAGGLLAGVPNENAGAAVLVGAVLAAGAPKEKPELP